MYTNRQIYGAKTYFINFIEVYWAVCTRTAQSGPERPRPIKPMKNYRLADAKMRTVQTASQWHSFRNGERAI